MESKIKNNGIMELGKLLYISGWVCIGCIIPVLLIGFLLGSDMRYVFGQFFEVLDQYAPLLVIAAVFLMYYPYKFFFGDK
ncbi:hypothetical protein [Niallia taxi]|uniref:hypothetical protein n=1 Tax=Niallia taxi TaxID=2499688 RepID=UPI0015F47649|nr:hypothetical protein [Niallia taxi]